MLLPINVEAIDQDDHTLDELTAAFETKEMFLERQEHHISAAVSDALFDRLGEEPRDYDVTVNGDTVPGLVLARLAALHAVEQGKGNEMKHLLTAAIARAAGRVGRESQIPGPPVTGRLTISTIAVRRRVLQWGVERPKSV